MCWAHHPQVTPPQGLFMCVGEGSSGFLPCLPSHGVLPLGEVCMPAQSSPTLCDPMDCSPPSFSVRGVSPARILEWAAISSSEGCSWPRDRTLVSCIGRQMHYHWATWEAHRRDLGVPDIPNKASWWKQQANLADYHHFYLGRWGYGFLSSLLGRFLTGHPSIQPWPLSPRWKWVPGLAHNSTSEPTQGEMPPRPLRLYRHDFLSSYLDVSRIKPQAAPLYFRLCLGSQTIPSAGTCLTSFPKIDCRANKYQLSQETTLLAFDFLSKNVHWVSSVLLAQLAFCLLVLSLSPKTLSLVAQKVKNPPAMQ